MEFLDRLIFFDLYELPFVLLAFLLGVTIHGFTQAFTSNKFNDPTAKKQGRLTLNPQTHLDFIGMLLFLFAGFGWGKPVPVNRHHFKKPKLIGVFISLAGPFSNLCFVLIGFLFWYLLFMGSIHVWFSPDVFNAINTFLEWFIRINILLFVVHLIPLPPLDGYRIIEDLAPNNVRAKMAKFELYSIYIFLLLALIPPLRMVTIQPILNLQFVIYNIINRFFSVIF
ncbi:site-2 protease family protein [Chengkuizengella marina]|uniref:Site-2 protease family protein n=1 Tax=Chengkuizengella marina TaxID=2507566 RepID=A0A6N9Q3U0_9BACL|nr:site-2 protease family protein [Chengkuizengella marina]NBI29472.1 site-2 protease family protein [Chengkuizengella marina]